MTDKLRYAYDSDEGFIVDMHSPPPEDSGLGSELLLLEVVDLLNALEQRVEGLEGISIVDLREIARSYRFTIDRTAHRIEDHQRATRFEVYVKALAAEEET